MKSKNFFKSRSTASILDKYNNYKFTLSKKQKNDLKYKGYLVLKPTKFIKKNLGKLRKEIDKLLIKEGETGGWEGKEKFYKKGKFFEPGTNRLGNLIEKNKIFAGLIDMPEILTCAKEVINDDLKVCGLNYREPILGQGEQKIHMDWKPRKSIKENYAGIVSMIYLDKSTKKNGSTRIIPGSHKKLGWPSDHINIFKKNKKEIRPNVEAGGTIVLNLNLWHAGSTNFSGKKRRMIMLNIKRRNLPQLLNYKKYLSDKTKKKLNEIQKYLLAVRNCDKTQKENSIGVGKYYKKDFHLKKKDIKGKQ